MGLPGREPGLQAVRQITADGENEKKGETVFTISPFRYLFCGIDWNRTSDARIFSPSLYRLSYDAISDLEVQIYEDFFILQQFHPGAKISLRILHTFAG